MPPHRIRNNRSYAIMKIQALDMWGVLDGAGWVCAGGQGELMARGKSTGQCFSLLPLTAFDRAVTGFLGLCWGATRRQRPMGVRGFRGRDPAV